MRTKIISILITLLFVTQWGCSYRLGYGDRKLKGGYTELAIPMFVNKTHEVNLESYFTNSLIREFHRSKVAQVKSKKSAPVVLEGVITKITVTREGVSEGGGLPENTSLASSYRLVVHTHLTLKRKSDQKTIWSSQFQGEKVYSAAQLKSVGINTSNPIYNNNMRQNTYEQIAVDMMNEAYNRLTEVL